jgi:hypothetical protein
MTGVQYRGVEFGGGAWHFRFDVGEVRVAVQINLDDGYLRVSHLAIAASDVNANTVRDIPFDRIKRDILEELRSNPALLDPAAVERQIVRFGGEDWYSPERLARLDAAEKRAHERVAAMRRSRGGRKPKPAEFWREVALECTQLRKSTRAFIEALADSHQVARATAAGWVQRCRQDGWLDGVQPGPRLLAWIDQQGHDDE